MAAKHAHRPRATNSLLSSVVALCALSACSGYDSTTKTASSLPAPSSNVCSKARPGLASGAPSLVDGVWVNISPPGIPSGGAQTMTGQGVALDPCNPSTLYWGNTPSTQAHGGLYKSSNAGGSWARVGLVDGNRMLDMPLKIRINPANSRHLYVGDGLRGNTMGFWVSTDSGAHFSKPPGWAKAAKDKNIHVDDVYDIAVNPNDFNHVLVSSHSPWHPGHPAYGNSAGLMESKDGGQTWIAHEPLPSWGYGHSIYFLQDPQKGLGNGQTWLLGTQGDGHWRTVDAGKTWTKVSSQNIFNGGGTRYYSQSGVLYVSAMPRLLRSTDNGATFTEVGPSRGYTAVWGDGSYLYTAPAYGFGPQQFLRSPEADGMTWTGFSSLFTDGGPSEMAYDSANSRLYASNWYQGLWVLKP